MTTSKNLYLNKPQLQAELDRCLNCKNQPCMNACPVNCNPQEFINHAKNGNYKEAVKTITRTNPMGQTCGLICPDKFCMKACTRSRIDFAINIPKVQATILENYREKDETEETVKQYNGKNIAVVGAGPAGMSAASALARHGYKITIYEASGEIGGALKMIPKSRLPHEVIEKDWDFIRHKGLITLQLKSSVSNPHQLLENGFDGVIVASGEPNCTALNIEGENDALSFMDYLGNPQKYQNAENVAVIGGGCVAVDCAFTARSNGAKNVEMFVRRKLSDMKITRTEYMELIDQKIDVTTMTSPVKIEPGNGKLSLYTCKNYFADDRLLPLPDTTIERKGFDLIIKAIGSFADRQNDTDKIIYAGDCKHGGSTIVEAIASGQTAAKILHEKLSDFESEPLKAANM